MTNRQGRVADASRILLVDDDANHRMLVKEILSDDKYQITEAEGGARALELIATQDFDGIKVCHEIRQRLKKDLLPMIDGDWF
jgi:CheY-like chemotaxis protein